MKHELSIREKKLFGFFSIVLGTLLLAYLSFSTEIFQELENRSWDWRLRQVAKQTIADSRIKIIGIDQSSIDQQASEEARPWPWPRSLYVPIIEYLKSAGAKGVAFDIMFTEFSTFGEADDRTWAESMTGNLPVVVAAALRGSAGSVPISPERFELFKSKQIQSVQKTSFTKRYPLNKNLINESVTLPITQFIESAAAIGNVTVPNDSDGVFRHFVAAQQVADIPILTLPFALYNSAHSDNNAYLPPLNNKEMLTLRFSGRAGSFKTYSFSAILNSFKQLTEGKSPEVPLSDFKDSYVLVGMNAPGLLDLRPTPLDPRCPGVEINATALDNLLNKTFIREANLLENLGYTLIFVALVAGAALFSFNQKMRLGLIALSFIALILSSYYAAIGGYWIQLFVPGLGFSLALLSAVSLQYGLEGVQTRFIKKAFRYYVSPEVIEKIIEDPTVLSLGGDRKELSIYFCDIAGFTSISESMDPATLVQFLNKFLTAMTTIILSHGGTVDKYVGDAIVAFWNAPLPDPEHASKAVLAAIECQNKLDEMRQELLKQFGHEVRLRIGLHTGTASVGNFGSLERFNYTVIGDAANLASRLEGANKSFGTDILMSEATYLKVKDQIPCLRVALIKVVGRDQAIGVYSPNRHLTKENADKWNTMVSLFESRKLSEASELLKSLPQTKLTSFYKERIKKSLVQSVDEWSAVLVLNEK